MNYARWETLEEMKKSILIAVDSTKKIKSSGLPMAYDKKNLYIDSRNTHSLVIGTTGSGKTQVVTLPMLKLACLAGESVIVHDSNDDVYDSTKNMFEKNKYKIIRVNLDEALNTNYWNPLDLAKKYYNEGNYDKSYDIIEKLGYYLLNEVGEKNIDPFWINSAISYFTGICLYLLENEKSPNFTKLYDIAEAVSEEPEEFLKKLDKHSPIYISLSGILTAPSETRGSIFSVFSNKFKRFIVKENLKSLLSKSDFDIAKISKEKTIVYIKSGKSITSKNLLPLFIDQVYSSKTDKNRLNIIIDDFYNSNAIKDFSRMLNYSRSLYISFIIMVRGFNDLKNVYGNEETEMIKLGFNNIVYLLSQDMQTIEDVSKLCGTKSHNEPLISIEELKTIKMFEAIIITTRLMPFRTKLLPYYEMENK